MSWRRLGIILSITLLVATGLLVIVFRDTNAQEQPLPAEPSFREKRLVMVRALVSRDILRTSSVIDAMKATPRHLFVPKDVRRLVYMDTPLPIGEGQTISAPSIVAKMTELLKPGKEHKVLEVGTGSGYQAAVLAPLVEHVYTIEIVPALAESARRRLERRYSNITVKCGDGYQGWPEHAPFDSIVVTCAPEEVPQPLTEQLKEGGRMVIPVGPEGGIQNLYLLEKKQGTLQRTMVWPVRFVPMTGETQQR